mgnify:FL=1
MNVYKGITYILFFLLIDFVNVEYIVGQETDMRFVIGAQAEWKRMDIGLYNMNFFTVDGIWFQNNTRFAVDFKSNNNFRFGTGYQYEYKELGEKIQRENRVMLFLHYLKKWNNWELKDLSTMEFRFINGALYNRYRNQLGLYYTHWHIAHPFILTEAFINVDRMQYIRQRTTIGARLPVDNLTFTLFGFHETTRILEQKWVNHFSFGIVGVYKFNEKL